MTRILSIDDSKSVHAFIDSILQPLQVKVHHAFDGIDGLEALRKLAAEKPDVVLLDWEMPRLAGIDALKQIRSDGHTMPVLMLTSKNSPEDIAKALQLGANEYVMKPFTPQILIDKIEAVLGAKLG